MGRKEAEYYISVVTDEWGPGGGPMLKLLLWIICSKVFENSLQKSAADVSQQLPKWDKRLFHWDYATRQCARASIIGTTTRVATHQNWTKCLIGGNTAPCPVWDPRNVVCLFGVTSLCFKRPTNASEEEEVWFLCRQPLNKHGQCLIQQKSESKWRFCSSRTFLVFLC